MPTPLELNYWRLIKIQNPKESLEEEFDEQETKEAIRMLSLSIVREWQCKIQSLQKTGGLGRVLKNAAQKCLMPRFLKTGLKTRRPSRVFKTGP